MICITYVTEIIDLPICEKDLKTSRMKTTLLLIYKGLCSDFRFLGACLTLVIIFGMPII